MASTLPSASMGSRTGKPIASIFTLEASILFSCTNAFHCAKAPSGGGAPSTLPSRSFGFDDAGLGHARDRERRLVVHHQHRLDLLVRILVLELDQRVDVEEADRIGAGCDAGDAGDRAGAGVDGDVEAFGLVVALVDGDEVRSGRPLELPVQGKLHVGLRERRACRERQHGRPREHSKKLQSLHI